nr:G-protein coupled receptor Mth2-like [Halyomorpha halys]
MRCVYMIRSVFFNCVSVVLLLQFSTVSSLCSNGTKCVPKCCPIGKIKTYQGCVPGGNILDVPEDVLVIHHQPNCSSMYYLEPGVDEYDLFYNGTLMLEEKGAMVPKNDFCLDENLLNTTFIYVCFPPAEDNSEKEKQLKVYSVGLFISLPFIFATFLVYACIKHKILRTLHAKCVKYHNLCLFLAYFLLGVTQNNLIQADIPCYILGEFAIS